MLRLRGSPSCRSSGVPPGVSSPQSPAQAPAPPASERSPEERSRASRPDAAEAHTKPPREVTTNIKQKTQAETTPEAQNEIQRPHSGEREGGGQSNRGVGFSDGMDALSLGKARATVGVVADLDKNPSCFLIFFQGGGASFNRRKIRLGEQQNENNLPRLSYTLLILAPFTRKHLKSRHAHRKEREGRSQNRKSGAHAVPSSHHQSVAAKQPFLALVRRLQCIKSNNFRTRTYSYTYLLIVGVPPEVIRPRVDRIRVPCRCRRKSQRRHRLTRGRRRGYGRQTWESRGPEGSRGSCTSTSTSSDRRPEQSSCRSSSRRSRCGGYD